MWICYKVQNLTVDLLLAQIVLKGAVSLLEMIEFYKSTCKLNLAYNSKIKIRGWQALSRTLKKVTNIISATCTPPLLFMCGILFMFNLKVTFPILFRLHVYNTWTYVTQSGQNKLFRCWDDP